MGRGGYHPSLLAVFQKRTDGLVQTLKGTNGVLLIAGIHMRRQSRIAFPDLADMEDRFHMRISGNSGNIPFRHGAPQELVSERVLKAIRSFSEPTYALHESLHGPLDAPFQSGGDCLLYQTGKTKDPEPMKHTP